MTLKGPVRSVAVVVVLGLVVASRLLQPDDSNEDDSKGGGGLAGDASGFAIYEGCRLVSHRNNDGDSFYVTMPDGTEQQLRLYFVDAPESAVKEYRDGNTNRKRLGHQGKYFSGLSLDATVRVGRDAKSWVKKALTDVREFTVYTRGDEVYDSGRIYVLVGVPRDGEERWLHELLVEEGLARIYTQGTDMPDGTSRSAQTRRLHGLEKAAKQARKGAWGLARN